MGYAMGFSACFGCGRMFYYNPMRVPSFPDPKTGQREPICKECIAEVNQKRIATGREPFKINPDAYDPIEESELP